MRKIMPNEQRANLLERREYIHVIPAIGFPLISVQNKPQNRSSLMNKIKFILLTAGLMLATTFTLSCSSDDGGGGSPSGGEDSSVSSSSDGGEDSNVSSSSNGGDDLESYKYCVFLEIEKCLDGPFSTCPQGGTLSNSCPYQQISSSSTMDNTISSSSSAVVESYKYCVFLETEKCLDGPFSACSQGGTLSNSCPYQQISSSSTMDNTISSSSSVVVERQYYDVTLGYWSNSCPDLNDYPELRNYVTPITDSNKNTILTCLTSPEYYTRNTSIQVVNFLETNGLSKYASEFDLRIAASPYDTAFLIYTNTSNYFRVLIIGYSD
jgi:hypothetical protein